MNKIAKAVVVELSVRDNMAPGGIMTSVKEVGFDGRYWWWKGTEGGFKNSYDSRFPNQTEKFRYTLSQELRSQQKAMRLMQEVRDKWDAMSPAPMPYDARPPVPALASEILKVAKELVSYGYHKSYSGDPYWITLKFPGACAKCHKPLARGEKAYWYPRTRTMFGEACGHGREAEIDFHNSVEMEEGHLV